MASSRLGLQSKFQDREREEKQQREPTESLFKKKIPKTWICNFSFYRLIHSMITIKQTFISNSSTMKILWKRRGLRGTGRFCSTAICYLTSNFVGNTWCFQSNCRTVSCVNAHRTKTWIWPLILFPYFQEVHCRSTRNLSSVESDLRQSCFRFKWVSLLCMWQVNVRKPIAAR